jgi:hypothetical protein
MGRCTPPEKEWTIVERVNSVEFNKFKVIAGEEREPKKRRPNEEVVREKDIDGRRTSVGEIEKVQGQKLQGHEAGQKNTFDKRGKIR